MFFSFYDPTYSLVLIGLLISIAVSSYLNITYAKYNKVLATKNITARDVVEKILAYNNINDISIGRINGNLTDHYSPKEKIIRLSDTTYDSSSIAAIGVAAHECGHVLQEKYNYGFLVLSMNITPIVSFCSQASIPIILISFLLRLTRMFYVGIILFSVTLAYQLITLPVEFNASNRAINVLREMDVLDEEELHGARQVLNAAAMTYVAAAVTTALQLLRFWVLMRGRRK